MPPGPDKTPGSDVQNNGLGIKDNQIELYPKGFKKNRGDIAAFETFRTILQHAASQ